MRVGGYGVVVGTGQLAIVGAVGVASFEGQIGSVVSGLECGVWLDRKPPPA